MQRGGNHSCVLHRIKVVEMNKSQPGSDPVISEWQESKLLTQAYCEIGFCALQTKHRKTQHIIVFTVNLLAQW